MWWRWFGNNRTPSSLRWTMLMMIHVRCTCQPAGRRECRLQQTHSAARHNYTVYESCFDYAKTQNEENKKNKTRRKCRSKNATEWIKWWMLRFCANAGELLNAAASQSHSREIAVATPHIQHNTALTATHCAQFFFIFIYIFLFYCVYNDELRREK